LQLQGRDLGRRRSRGQRVRAETRNQLVEGDLLNAKWVASQIAIERAVEKTGTKRAITFHSRVSSAKDFSTDGTRGIRQYLPEFSVFHVNGEQKSSERKQIIRSFRDAREALITNARCLTEGIDVPAVDMVGFIDPRRSRIDIVQATGRAMRKPQGSNKEVGYVVIPLFLDSGSGETLEEALERSEFDDVADVLNEMQDQDEDLVQIIRELQEAKGQEKVFDPQKLLEKIEVLGPSIELRTLQSNICAKIVDRIGASWDEMFGRLLLFRDTYGHARVPMGYTDKKLAKWVQHQRTFASKGNLSAYRKRRLDDIGFSWDPFETAWEEGFRYLAMYKEREGHCAAPAEYKTSDGYRLGQWVSVQRQSRDNLTTVRKARLDALGFDWDPITTQWEEGFECLKEYVREHEHCRVPAQYITLNGYRLGGWVSAQRLSIDSLLDERKARLDALGFDWDPHETSWNEGFEHLLEYLKEHKDCNVRQQFKSPVGYKLGQWVGQQRTRHDTLSAQKKAKLDALGFDWDPIRTQWADGFKHLQEYVEEHKDCNVPALYTSADGYRLGTWVTFQRVSQNRLPSERKTQLDKLGFDWDPITTQWEKGFSHLQAYLREHKDCIVPYNYKSSDGYNLGAWVTRNRKRKSSLSFERIARLDALGFDWIERHDSLWEKGFEHYQEYLKEHKHCNVSQQYKSSDGYKLGLWVSNQRNRRSSLSIERLARLDAVGFDWDPIATQWKEGLQYLKSYKAREGHCRVPGQHIEDG
jgi:hypothetical protein